jgi:glycerol uptake facilitator-like aquaporin
LIPLWIELALAGFVVLYFIGWAILVLCGNDVLAPDGRKNSAMAAIFVSIAYVAVVIFMGLLVGRVDSADDNPFVGIFVPLHITLVSFILLAFVQKGGNPCKANAVCLQCITIQLFLRVVWHEKRLL